MSKVLHYEVRKGKCITPCPYREGKLIGSIRCGECVFFNRKDADSGMMICDWDNYSEH